MARSGNDLKPVPAEWQSRVDDAVESGDVGRAVELLESWIDTHAYTPWALERLGRLWLGAGFRKRAGRALFWSGVRGEPDVDAAIRQFVDSTTKPGKLLQSLKARAQVPFVDYPERVRRDLEAHGVTASDVDERLRGAVARAPEGSWFGCLFTFVIVAILLVGFGVVFVTGARTVWGWLTGA